MSGAPVRPTPDTAAATVVERFQRLSAAWHRDTDFLSSMEDAKNHPAWQEIVRLGPEVVPLLVRDLEDHHTHWFAALEAITGARPVPVTAAGDIPQMAEAWLRWAKDKGYRW